MMKLGLFADSHCSTREVSCRTRRPSLSLGKIQQAMEAFTDVDLVVCMGDLVDDCDFEHENRAMLERVAGVIHSCGKPFFCLRGNHDCDMFSEDEFYTLAGGRPPFLLKQDGCALIFLNANYARDGSEYAVRSVDWTNTALPEQQMLQLKQTLADPEIRSAYVFVHQNLDPNVQYQHILSNAGEVRKILEDSGKVRRVIQGHYHPGCDSTVGGIEYHTLPAMCEGAANHFEIMEI